MEKNFYYEKLYSFLTWGILCITAGGLSFIPLIENIPVQFYPHPSIYYTLNFSLIIFGISNITFWLFHLHKGKYITISNNIVKIDAEMNIILSDIVDFKINHLNMLYLKIKDEKSYKFSWRFKADRIFHPYYNAFICIQLVQKSQRQDLVNFFVNHVNSIKK
ncbi:MAG: hypothetical protein MJ250_01505 [Alphaproteobacteria bacterium]|nr:hypothetical protein [Alphaproteobacteria bacterium]